MQRQRAMHAENRRKRDTQLSPGHAVPVAEVHPPCGLSLAEWLRMDLIEVRRLAGAVVDEHAPELEVLAVTAGEGGAAYAELFLGVRDCVDEPCRVAIGLDRDMSSEQVR